MVTTRRPAVAGLFYPGGADELRSAVRHHLADAAPSSIAPKALIAPHAGYVYSGPVAGSAYAAAARRRGVARVVLLGPSHRVPVRGLALPASDAFLTPLGAVRVDREACASVESLPQVVVDDGPHAAEHSLEVQLPFLQVVYDDVSIVPFSVGDSPPELVAEVIDLLWGGDETLIVVSSDLSHYLGYDEARHRDSATTSAIERLDAGAVHSGDACGAVCIRGLLRAAGDHGLAVTTLDLRNSGDTAGPRDSVVGYGAYALA